MTDRTTCNCGLLAAMVLVLAATSSAEDWYVSPEGKPANSGRRESPWDIASALGAHQKVAPGDTVYLLPGTYRRRPEADFEIRLVGTADRPIHVRSVPSLPRSSPGGRATIDGGLVVRDPSAHVWVRDLEILVSENFSMPRELNESGSHPKSYNRPWGGLNLYGGTGCKYINLVIHDCAQGISSWTGAKDVEIYGCLVYENGWKAPDRGHGHCIYTQNRHGTKVIRHCILSAKYPGSYTMHAYGSKRAYVDNYRVEENIAYGQGPFLIGGGRPSRNIRALGNILHDVSMRIGYNAPQNEDCEVRGNVIVDGRLDIVRYKKVINEHNLVFSADDPRPEQPLARWLPSSYDSSRAHLAVFNWNKEETVTIDARPFLTHGDRFRLVDPKNVFGKPIHQGVCQGSKITIPAGDAFRAFVVFRDKNRRAPTRSEAPNWVVYPDKEWKTLSPAEAGITDVQAWNNWVQATRKTARGASFHGEDHSGRKWGVAITRAGYLIQTFGDPDYRFQTASIGKCFTMACLQLAIDEGLIKSADDLIKDHWTGKGQLNGPHKYLDQGHHVFLTFNHLKSHRGAFPITNGWSWKSRKNYDAAAPKWSKWTGDPDKDNYAHARPGTVGSVYSSGGYWRLSQALTSVWQKDLKQVLDERIMSHIGIPAGRWDWTPGKVVHDKRDWYPKMPGYGEFLDPPYEIEGQIVRGGPGWVVMSAKDLARWGLLVARGGEWKGKRLISRIQGHGGGNGSHAGGKRGDVFGSWGRVTSTFNHGGIPWELFNKPPDERAP